jgi:hypothetical protein
VCALVWEESHVEGKAVKVHQLDKEGGGVAKALSEQVGDQSLE